MYIIHHRAQTEWQWPISGVNSIMMEKSALAGKVFHSIFHHVKVAVYASAERADTLPVFHLYDICT
jgi:hypothetical protein